MRHFFSTAFAVLLAIIGTGSKAQQTGEPPRAPQTMEQAEAQLASEEPAVALETGA